MATAKRRSNGKSPRRRGNHLSRDAQRAFLKRLVKLRGANTRNSFNTKLGLPQASWHQYEAGHTMPNLVTLAKLRKATKVDLNWLISGR